MLKRRLPRSFRRGAPWLAFGVIAALIALPGLAYAGGSGDVGGEITNQLPGLTAPSLPLTTSAADTTTPSTSTSSSSSSSAPALPSPPIQQIQAALEQAGVSAKCADAVQNDLMQLQTDIPGSLQAIIAALTSAGGSNPPSAADLQKALQDLLNGKIPSASTPTDTTTPTSSGTPPDAVATDLQQLVTDFTTYCIPAPPTGLPSTPTSSAAAASPPGQQEQPQTQPVSTPQATQPVTYPGYAATGGAATTALRPASDQRPSATIPLAVLGSVLLVSAAAAAGIRARHHGR